MFKLETLDLNINIKYKDKYKFGVNITYMYNMFKYNFKLIYYSVCNNVCLKLFVFCLTFQFYKYLLYNFFSLK